MRHAIKMIGLVSVLTVSACGGYGQDEVRRFIGTWRPTAATATTVCPGYAPYTEPQTSNMIWSAGVSSDLIATDPGTSCAMMADVRGATASGVPGQSCLVPDGAGGLYTFTTTGYTFVISADGQTATENGSSQVTWVGQGATVACSITESGSYQKIGN